MPQNKTSLPMVQTPHQDHLDDSRGYWRSLVEHANSPEFDKLLQEHFPEEIIAPQHSLDRRRFLMLLGASLGLAGLSGCRTSPPAESILPYVRQPEEVVPGEPLYFATSMPLAGYATGLLVKSLMGRPIKIEGNPSHPANAKPIDSPAHAQFGPTDLYAQASLLTMYDPDRSQTVQHLGSVSTWERFISHLQSRLQYRDQVRLRLLTGTITSPALAHQIQVILRRFPQAQWHVHEPAEGDNSQRTTRQVFGEPLDFQYRFDRADRILSLESDFLSCGPGHLRYVRDFMSRRKVQTEQQRQQMNRLYVIESMPSLTGTKADHRWPLRSSQIESFARAVASRLEINAPGQAPVDHSINDGWIRHLVEDLQNHSGKSIVIAGKNQLPIVHALAYKMNEALGNIGRTVIPTAPIMFRENAGSFEELTEAMARREVDVLLMLECNPIYTAPTDLNFAEKLNNVPFRAHLGLYDDETSANCHWHVPAAHYLESWGDARAFDGTVSMIQPMIAPLYGGKTSYEVLALLTNQPERTSFDIVRSYWRSIFDLTHPWNREVRGFWQRQGLIQSFSGGFESWWRRALHEGYVPNTALAEKNITVQEDWHQVSQHQLSAENSNTLEINFLPDPTIYDGRFANNGWLQELPKPLTKLTWDNAALLSPTTAARLGLAPQGRPEQANGKVVRLAYKNRNTEAPVWVLPGHADNAVTLHLGYGRSKCGNVGSERGFDAYKLRSSATPWFDLGLTLTELDRTIQLATTQHHHLIEDHEMSGNRHLIWSADVQDYHRLVEEIGNHHGPLPSLYPEREYEDRKWGMAIDINSCTGCSACVVACQSENNIPVVGKEEVTNGRELHWLRIDTYYSGDPERPESLETYHQPVPCMHCENAPCETVCPVEATVHSSDGLNDMIYNRCVGTRYCANNCPYKVRRFNYLQYADWETDTYRLMRNPEVTTRTRGVMEKCTYCVQRIRKAEINAELEGRGLLDGEIQTSCQAACPAGAIVFGDLNQQASKVAQQQAHEMNYSLLHEHNTRPRTTYQAALRNPNPEIRES